MDRRNYTPLYEKHTKKYSNGDYYCGHARMCELGHARRKIMLKFTLTDANVDADFSAEKFSNADFAYLCGFASCGG